MAARLGGTPQDKNLYKVLKHGTSKRKRGNRRDSKGTIRERPDVVEQRSRLGDIEVDLMVGKAHKSTLLVLTDRAAG